ncbi:hypothetical protein Peur_035267 [Populus x canadensis]
MSAPDISSLRFLLFPKSVLPSQHRTAFPSSTAASSIFFPTTADHNSTVTPSSSPLSQPACLSSSPEGANNALLQQCRPHPATDQPSAAHRRLPLTDRLLRPTVSLTGQQQSFFLHQ